MRIVGIDPGCSGAIAVLNGFGGVEGYLIMPLIKIGSKSRVNGAAVASFLRGPSITHAYLE